MAQPKAAPFFMPKEPFLPEESDRGRDKKQEEIIEIHAVGVPERKPLGEAVEAAFLARPLCWGFLC